MTDLIMVGWIVAVIAITGIIVGVIFYFDRRSTNKWIDKEIAETPGQEFQYEALRHRLLGNIERSDEFMEEHNRKWLQERNMWSEHQKNPRPINTTHGHVD